MADADVPDVLRRLGIDAKRQGREWLALCPNPEHDDKKPSWRIRDQPGTNRHGLHHCWPCGFGGDLVDLVKARLGIGWEAARDWLGSDAAAVERPVAREVEFKVRSVDSGFRLPLGVDLLPLDRWPKPARRYLDVRKIPPWQVERWGVGFSVEGRLQGRIVFVKRDAQKKIVGYSARTFTNAPIRYLEPKPEERANPSAVFGEEHWTERRDRVYVAEGAINALAIERVLARDGDFPCVADTSGSELRPMVAVKIASFGEVVSFADPDKAGDKVALAIEMALARHSRNFRRVRLPTGKDAASVDEDVLREAVGTW